MIRERATGGTMEEFGDCPLTESIRTGSRSGESSSLDRMVSLVSSRRIFRLS